MSIKTKVKTKNSGLTDFMIILQNVLFQIVFIVFVSAQGIFIAAFHCLRSQEVRQHWYHLLTTGSTTLDLSSLITASPKVPRAQERKQSLKYSDNDRCEVIANDTAL